MRSKLAANVAAATLLLAIGGCAVDGLVTSGIQSAATAAGSSVRIELPTSLGSGVYIGNGVIITAAHVVTDAPRPVVGTASDGKQVFGPPTIHLISDQGDVQDGEVLWLNKDYDIAAVRPKNARRFTVASLACRKPVLGESLSAEGNPLGMQFITMHGYVSGDVRPLEPNWKEAFITDMTTISGMSGGPVYDAGGEVIGITVGSADPNAKPGNSAVAAWGFAVPSSVVCGLLGRGA